MRNRTAILASAILAVGGFGLVDPIVSLTFAQPVTPTQHPAGQGTSAGGQSGAGANAAQPQANHGTRSNNPGANLAQRDQKNETKGVQQLFAQATDEALKPNGVQQLQSLFASENTGQMGMNGANHITAGNTGAAATGSSSKQNTGQSGATGSNSTSGGTSGLSARAGSANSQSHNAAGQAQSDQNQPDQTRQGQNNQADMQALNKTIKDFDLAWKQKYGSDFSVQNASQVYADITAADIMPGMPQPAGSGLRGNDNPEASGTSAGNAGATGSTATTGAKGTTGSAQAGSSTSPTGGLHQNVGPTGSTAGASTRGQAGPGARSNTTAGTGIGAAGNGMINEEVTVNVPPVQGTQAVTVRLLRTGPSSFSFASQTQHVREGRLASALEQHLRDVMAQKDRWPADKNQAARLVTQHVLMAIAECQNGMSGHASMGLGSENAQPAASRIPANPHPDTTLGSAGTGQLNTKGRTPGAANNNR